MCWDREAQERAKSQTCCYLCGKRLKRGDRFRDHDHLSGRFRGMTCLVCNLKFSSLHQLKIPVIMHNSSRYDLYFLIKTLHKVNERFSIIPKNSEQFLALELGSFLFIDSFLHLGESLGVSAQNLRDKGKDSFAYTLKHSDPTKQDLLLQKGVFCYAYLDDFRNSMKRVYRHARALSMICTKNTFPKKTILTPKTFGKPSLVRHLEIIMMSI